MAAFFVLGWDRDSKRVVHIDDVAEGYPNCECPSCGEQLIASNRNAERRQVATYFRHSGKQICNPETALHLYAKQVIANERRILLPALEEVVVLKNTVGQNFSRTLSIPSAITSLSHVSLEKQLPNSLRIPDVSARENDGEKLFIEIKVHHGVDKKKSDELQALNLDVIEINLHDLFERKRLSKADIDKAVIEDAPRVWVSQKRFNSRISSLRSKLKKEVDRDNKRIAENAKVTKKWSEECRKEKSDAKRQWREIHHEKLELIERYALVENRLAALYIFEQRLTLPDFPEYVEYKWLMDQFGRIPDIVNIPVKGELAFKAHRTYWQTLIFRDVICMLYDQTIKNIESQKKHSRKHFYGDVHSWSTEEPSVMPNGIYAYLKPKVRLNTIASVFERISDGPLLESYKSRADSLKFVTAKEYELLPKPVPVIRRYLIELAKIGILAPSGDVYYFPYQTRPQMDIQVNSYEAISSKGMEQYS